jgi:hypothetical protein
MTDYVRMIAIGGTVGALVAGTLATPAFIGAVAGEQKDAVVSAITDLFPAPFDPKFFRKYAINFDDTVSTDIKSTTHVKKLGYGYTTNVSIVTTPSGTYSSDGLLSPNVRYPGIEVKPKYRGYRGGGFHFSSSTSRYGTGTWTSFTSGSITFYTYSYKPVKRT